MLPEHSVGYGKDTVCHPHPHEPQKFLKHPVMCTVQARARSVQAPTQQAGGTKARVGGTKNKTEKSLEMDNANAAFRRYRPPLSHE